MKASSFLKIGVNENLQNAALKKHTFYYTYNIIKRNTQGLVLVLFSQRIFRGKHGKGFERTKPYGAGIRQE